MLGIDFLKKEVPFQFNIAGVEFMDRANPALFYKLQQFFLPLIKVEEIEEESVRLDMSKSDYTDLATMIFKETGICVDIRAPSTVFEPGIAIDVGYFMPQHIFNHQDADSYFSAKHSNVAQAMRALKTDVLKGWVDTTTGKIGGDFSKVQFTMLLGGDLKSYLSEEMHVKYQIGYNDSLATFVLHELGHVFAGFYTLSQTCIDISMCYVTSRLIAQAENGTTKLSIVKDFGKETGTEVPVKEKDLEGLDESGAEILLSKLTEDRNTRRTLSLGLVTQSAETYADMYAMKMGCPKTMVIALSALTKSQIAPLTGLVAPVALTAALIALAPPVGIGFGMVTIPLAAILTVSKVTHNLIDSVEYDSPYRRMKNVLRVYASEISSNKKLSARDKANMLKDAKEMEKAIEESKSALEGTGFQRFFNWMRVGGEFKARDFEHYNQELLSHNLSLYNEYFSTDKE